MFSTKVDGKRVNEMRRDGREEGREERRRKSDHLGDR